MRDVNAAAVEERTVEQEHELARPPRDATFVARCHNLILSLFPQLRENVSGMTRDLSPGFRLQFIGHNFTVTPRERREFEKFINRYGRAYAMDDQDYEEVIKGRSLEDWIRANYAFGSNNPDGFYESVAAIPEPTDELTAILEAYMDEDADAIEAVLDAEVAGHGRKPVIEKANLALEKLHLAAAERALGDQAQGPQAPA